MPERLTVNRELHLADITFDACRPDQIPEVQTLLAADDMFDARRDATDRMKKVIDSRPTSTIVGSDPEGHVAVFSYMGDVLPLVSALVVRPDCRGLYLPAQVFKVAEGIAAGMGHKHIELITKDLTEYYADKHGFSVTDTECTLMERSIAGTPGGRQTAEIGTENYAPAMYHRSFDIVMAACKKAPADTHGLLYPVIDKQGAQAVRPQISIQHLLEFKNLPFLDLFPEEVPQVNDSLRAWSYIKNDTVDTLIGLRSKEPFAQTIWGPEELPDAQLTYYYRSQHEGNGRRIVAADVRPVAKHGEWVYNKLLPSGKYYNCLMTSAQEILRRELVTGYEFPG